MTALTQRREALEIANHVRSHNHQRKVEIKAMPRREAFRAVAAIIESPDGPVGAMQVNHALESIHQIGPHRVARVLLRAGVYLHTRRVRDLTPRQRSVLAQALRAYGEHA